MATPPNDDTKMLFKLLSDREWHSYNEIKEALAQTVPPGRALRKYAERVEYNRRSKHGKYETLPSENDQIVYGQRGIAQNTITSWQGRGLWIRGKGSDKEIKVRPGFSSYGIPGFEPPASSAPREPGSQAPGEPEVARGDSEPSETDRSGPQEVAGAVPAEPPPEAEPQPGPEVVEDLWLPGPADVEPERALPDPHAEAAYEWSAAPTGPVMVPASATACIACGMLVLDVELHARWHQELSEEASGRDFTLDNLMSRFDNAISAKLDAFQAGMELWLTDQFDMLEQAILNSRPASRWRETARPQTGSDLPARKSE